MAEKLTPRKITLSLIAQRFDSFIELVSSSVEYGESASYQLQPAKTKKPLNLRELRNILSLSKQMRDDLSRRASGVVQ